MGVNLKRTHMKLLIRAALAALATVAMDQPEANDQFAPAELRTPELRPYGYRYAWGKRSADAEASPWGKRSADAEAKYWGKRSADAEARYWGKRSADAEASPGY